MHLLMLQIWIPCVFYWGLWPSIAAAALLLCPLQAVANLQKRREGAPRSGKVSFVVTDIESYSGVVVRE